MATTVDLDTISDGLDTGWDRARPSLLRGTFAISQTVWNLPERKVGDRPAHCPWNPDPDADPDDPPTPIFIIEPRAVLHCLKFDGKGGITGRVRLNTRLGTFDAPVTGAYDLRKNVEMSITDGVMTVTIPAFRAINTLYLVRRTADEVDLLMRESKNSVTGEAGTALPVFGGTLKRVYRSWWDWSPWLPWPF